VKSFGGPQQAADSLIDATAKFDVAALIQILGPGGGSVVSAVNSRTTESEPQITT